MRLDKAIVAWLKAHESSLSASTQRDVSSIAAAVDASGWSGLDCSDVERDIRKDIATYADQVGNLDSAAVNEFLEVVLQWRTSQIKKSSKNKSGKKQSAKSNKTAAANQAGLGPTDAFDAADGLGPSGAFDSTDIEPALDDEEHDQEAADADIIESQHTVDEADSETDDDQHGDADDDWHDDDDDDRYDDDDEDRHDDRYDNRYDDDDADDDGDDRYDNRYDDDADDRYDDEDDDDRHDDDDDESAAASSFFNKVDESSPTQDTLLATDSGIDSEEVASTDGVFSRVAAEENSPKSIDWITTLYFTIAGLCFAAVIFFYLVGG